MLASDESFKLIFGENIEERLVSIFINEVEYKVPSDVNLLRALHYLSITTNEFDLKLQKHCWGGTCENCKSSFKDSQLGIAECLACQMDVEEGIHLVSLPRTMKKKIPHGD
jgi:ferredoxin